MRHQTLIFFTEHGAIMAAISEFRAGAGYEPFPYWQQLAAGGLFSPGVTGSVTGPC
jgi:hypothetical protein